MRVGFVVPEGEKFKWALFVFVSVQSSLLVGFQAAFWREHLGHLGHQLRVWAQAGSTLFYAALCCSAILASILGCLVFTVLAPYHDGSPVSWTNN